MVNSASIMRAAPFLQSSSLSPFPHPLLEFCDFPISFTKQENDFTSIHPRCKGERSYSCQLFHFQTKDRHRAVGGGGLEKSSL